MRKGDETVESYWSNELGERVEIREFKEWNEIDLYLNGHFAQTFVSMDAAEQYLGHYYMTRDFAIGQGR